MEAGRRFRNLGRQLEGVIFQLPNLQHVEACIEAQKCRAPAEAIDYLRFMKKERPVFLFEEDRRVLHGVLKLDGAAELVKEEDTVKVRLGCGQYWSLLDWMLLQKCGLYGKGVCEMGTTKSGFKKDFIEEYCAGDC